MRLSFQKILILFQKIIILTWGESRNLTCHLRKKVILIITSRLGNDKSTWFNQVDLEFSSRLEDVKLSYYFQVDLFFSSDISTSSSQFTRIDQETFVHRKYDLHVLVTPHFDQTHWCVVYSKKSFNLRGVGWTEHDGRIWSSSQDRFLQTRCKPLARMNLIHGSKPCSALLSHCRTQPH